MIQEGYEHRSLFYIQSAIFGKHVHMVTPPLARKLRATDTSPFSCREAGLRVRTSPHQCHLTNSFRALCYTCVLVLAIVTATSGTLLDRSAYWAHQLGWRSCVSPSTGSPGPLKPSLSLRGWPLHRPRNAGAGRTYLHSSPSQSRSLLPR